MPINAIFLNFPALELEEFSKEIEEEDFEEDELEALEELQEEEAEKLSGGKKNKNNSKDKKMKRKSSRTHSHIHIPHGHGGETDDIDVVKEFYKLSEYEQAEIMILLKPISFFRCVMGDFEQACHMYMDEHTV